MLLSAVSVLVVAQSSSEIPEGLMNNSVLLALVFRGKFMIPIHLFLIPIWTDGIQLWGCTKQSNINIIQGFQNKVLTNMVSAPWYVRNNDLHRDLQVNVVSSEIQRFAQKHEGRLHHHENVQAILLLDNAGIVRRLQRKKPF
jgi:hypothetical protein